MSNNFNQEELFEVLSDETAENLSGGSIFFDFGSGDDDKFAHKNDDHVLSGEDYSIDRAALPTFDPALHTFDHVPSSKDYSIKSALFTVQGELLNHDFPNIRPDTPTVNFANL